MVGYNLCISEPEIDMAQRPAWLEALLTETFFESCSSHSSIKKNERNVFCLDCLDVICQHCLPGHRSHKLLQVRRYVYHDVIRVQDIEQFVDCALVQRYIINGAKVVFLNQRPQPRPSRGFGNICETCDRSLQDNHRYCSLGCKSDAFVRRGSDFSSLIRNVEPRDDFVISPAESLKSDSDNEDLSPNSVLDDPHSATSSGSTANDSVSCQAFASTATTPFVNPPAKKSRSFRSTTAARFFLGSTSAANLNGGSNNNNSKHRKGVPHRSPLC